MARTSTATARRTCELLATALCVLLTSLPAAGQEAPDTFRLRELVVSATRLPVPIAEAPGAVTVISGASMRERGLTFVADALRTVPGVTVASSAGPGALTAVFMRGGESDYVQVLVDGVQVNDPGGAFNWAHLRAAEIDRIEVVRGPASVLYGSDAVSGVVHIFTRAGGAPRIDASVTSGRGDRPADAAGTFDTHALDLSATGSTTPSDGTLLRYGITAGHTTSTGLYAFNSDYDNTTLSARLALAAGAADASLSARSVEHDYHYPTSGSGMVVDENQFATGSARSLGLATGYRPAERLELRVDAALHRTDSRTENPPDGPDDGASHDTAEQLRRSIDARANMHLPRGTVLTVGVDREWQRATTAWESVSGFGTFGDSADNRRTNTGYYAQLHGTPVHTVALTAGARIDDNEVFGTFRTARAAASWRPIEAARLHAAFGTAFKEPTFYENFATGFVRGNPDLEPERSTSREVGAELALAAGRLTLGATAFDQRFRNLIQYTGAPPTPEEPNYFNVGSARARGVELSARAHAGDVSITSAYTYTATRVLDDGFGTDPLFAQDQPLLRRPKHHATASAAWQISNRTRALLDVRHTGRREDLDFTDPEHWSGLRTELDAYTLFDIGTGITLFGATAATAGNRTHGEARDRAPDGRPGRSLDLTLRVRNLFDTSYEEIYNFPAAGRVLQLGLRASL